jgi:predicted DNA-binding transcriptional regulator AlpA
MARLTGRTTNRGGLALREVASYLDLTPQRVHQLSLRPDFPPPTVVGFGPPVWDEREIATWAEAHPCGRRRWGPRAPDPSER